MNTNEDMRIVLRAVVTLQAVKRSLGRSQKGTAEYTRLLSTVVSMEEQLDEALEAIADQLLEYANDA